MDRCRTGELMSALVLWLYSCRLSRASQVRDERLRNIGPSKLHPSNSDPCSQRQPQFQPHSR